MGCNLSRQQNSPEEAVYQQLEKSLKIHRYSARDLICCFKNICGKQDCFRLSPKQLLEFENILKLKQSNCTKLFQKYKDGQYYDGIQLISYLIVLSSSRAETKAQLLFELYDEFDTDELKRSEAELLFKSIYISSADFILEILSPGQQNNTNLQIMKDTLLKSQSCAVYKIINEIFYKKTAISKSNFIYKFSIKGNQRYLISSGLRALGIEMQDHIGQFEVISNKSSRIDQTEDQGEDTSVSQGLGLGKIVWESIQEAHESSWIYLNTENR